MRSGKGRNIIHDINCCKTWGEEGVIQPPGTDETAS